MKQTEQFIRNIKRQDYTAARENFSAAIKEKMQRALSIETRQAGEAFFSAQSPNGKK